MTTEELHRFLAWERGRSSQPKSINRRLHTLRLFYRFVNGREGLPFYVNAGSAAVSAWRVQMIRFLP